MRFSNKQALIIGGSSGMGLEAGRLLVNAGASVTKVNTTPTGVTAETWCPGDVKEFKIGENYTIMKNRLPLTLENWQNSINNQIADIVKIYGHILNIYTYIL